MKKITIVTINFNSEKETHNCLASLKKLNIKNLEVKIVVVDNGSKDPFVLTSEEKESVYVIHTGKNLGFTGGSNVGIEYALKNDADFVLLINNDTIVDSELIQELLKPFEADTKVGLVVPKIYFAKGHEYHKDNYKREELGKVLWFAGGYVDWANIFTRHQGVDEVDRGQYDSQKSITFATGCCMLLSREIIEKVGGFDDRYYLYFEDGDLSQRIIKAGYEIIYNPKGKVWHITAASGGGSGSLLHDYYLTRNRILFGMRYAPIRSKIALIRESLRLFFNGRQWQRKGVVDFYIGNMGKGSYRVK